MAPDRRETITIKDSDSDDDVQITSVNFPTLDIPRKKLAHSSASNVQRGPDPKKVSAVPRPSLKKADYDFTKDSDGDDTESNKQSSKRDPKSVHARPLVKTAARKSTPSGPVPIQKAGKSRSGAVNESYLSSEDDFPPVSGRKRTPQTSTLTSQKKRMASNGMDGTAQQTLKRPLSISSSSPASVRPAKKSKSDALQTTGRSPARGSSLLAERDVPHVVRRKPDANGSNSASLKRGHQRDTASPKKSASQASQATADREPTSHKSASPLAETVMRNAKSATPALKAGRQESAAPSDARSNKHSNATSRPETSESRKPCGKRSGLPYRSPPKEQLRGSHSENQGGVSEIAGLVSSMLDNDKPSSKGRATGEGSVSTMRPPAIPSKNTNVHRSGSVNEREEGADTQDHHTGTKATPPTVHAARTDNKGSANKQLSSGSKHDRAQPRSEFEPDTGAAEADRQLQSEASRATSASGAFALPKSAASVMKSTEVYTELSLAGRVEKTLGQYLEELAQHNDYWTSSALSRARQSKSTRQTPHAQQEEPTSFRRLKPLQTSPISKTQASGSSWTIEKMANGKPVKTEMIVVPRQSFSTSGRNVPGYSHYVSIANNTLAKNSKNLHYWPFFGDDYDSAKVKHDLGEQFYLDIAERELKLLRLHQAQQYEAFVYDALKDLDCSWADVLRFLLLPEPDVGADLDARRALKNRNDFCKEQFDRSNKHFHKRWLSVVQALPPSTSERTARAAVLCEIFQKLARLPLWHIARRNEICRLSEEAEDIDRTPASDDLTCRICLQLNCSNHGEIRERPDDADPDSDADSSDASVVVTDLVHPPQVNYRTRVVFPDEENERADGLSANPPKRTLQHWQSFQYKADSRGPFYPCSHPGKACEDEGANCLCRETELPCEKGCGCARSCSRKFQGCSCSTQRIKGGRRGPCFDDERCLCFQLNRECDPDLCGDCRVCEVVAPENKFDESVLRGRCQNADVQRGVPKHTVLGTSGIHGLGLFAAENIGTGQFVGEYKGELITKEEAERRGAVYEHQKLSYLFSLNSEQEIDSTYFGNKIRFINHAKDKRENLFPRIIMVDCVHRIGLYACQKIRKGEELLFNYGPKFPEEQLGMQSKKSAPHVRNSNLLKDFDDAEEHEEDIGDVRATAAGGQSKGKRRGRPLKPKGGARPGAGRKPLKPVNGADGAVCGIAQTREESPFIDDGDPADQDAGRRLAAYNVADDRSDLGQMDLDVDMDAGADDEDEEYQESSDGADVASEQSWSD